jgi:hypothetical protein
MMAAYNSAAAGLWISKVAIQASAVFVASSLRIITQAGT